MEDQVLIKIQAWCAKAERSTSDVVRRLLALGVPEDEIQGYLNRLRAEKFLDDGRYARSFAEDRWRLQGWGREKIRQALAQKGMDEAIIEDALAQIPADDYEAFREQLLRQKLIALAAYPPAGQAARIFRFAASRGIEEDWIRDWLSRHGLDDA